MGPHYDLSRIREAAEMDRVRLGGSRCRDLLLPFLGELLICRNFAREVAMSLQPEDYMATITSMQGGPWDEYGVSIEMAMAREFGLEAYRTWYLKVKLMGGPDEEELFFLSLHRPEHPLRRIGGVLDP